MRLRNLMTLAATLCAGAFSGCGDGVVLPPELAEVDDVAQAITAPRVTRWSSGFESGYPGEFSDWNRGFTASGGLSGSNQAWNILPSFPGARGAVYKGWIDRRNAPCPMGSPTSVNQCSHRAYPVLHTRMQTPLVNQWRVYLDVDYSKISRDAWIQLATWSSAATPDWQPLQGLVVVRGQVRPALHYDEIEYVGPSPQPNFPLRRWVTMSAYLTYDRNVAEAHIWQDDQLIFIARSYLGADYGTELRQVHWGMYGHYSLADGEQYNDDMKMWTTSTMKSFSKAPVAPF